MLHETSVHALVAILEDPGLHPRKQLRALQGLAYAAKDLGPNIKAEVANAVVTLCGSNDIAVRSRAANLAVGCLSLLKSLGGPDAERHLQELKPRVLAAVREAALLGLMQPTDQTLAGFLSRER